MDKPSDSAMTMDELSAYLKIAKSTLSKPVMGADSSAKASDDIGGSAGRPWSAGSNGIRRMMTWTEGDDADA